MATVKTKKRSPTPKINFALLGQAPHRPMKSVGVNQHEAAAMFGMTEPQWCHLVDAEIAPAGRWFGPEIGSRWDADELVAWSAAGYPCRTYWAKTRTKQKWWEVLHGRAA